MATGGMSYNVNLQTQQAKKNADELAKKLKEQETQAKKSGAAIKKTGVDAKGAGKSFSGLTAQLGGVIAGYMGVTQAVSFLGSALRVEASFQKNLAEVATLVDTNIVSMAEWRKQILDMDVPQSFDDLTKGLYDIVSAGIPANKAMITLRVAADLATAGVSTTAQSADLLTTVLNAYKIGADGATKASSELFTAVRLGKLTITELAASMGDVASTADTAGVSLSGTLAAIVEMTKAGVKVAEATTAINMFLMGMIKITPDAARAMEEMGLNISAATLKSEGLGATLVKIAEASDEDIEALAKLVPSIRALKAAVILATDGGANFVKTQEEIAKSTTAVAEAVDEVTGSLDDQMNRLDKSWKQLKMTTVEGISVGGLTPFLDTLTAIQEMLNKIRAGMFWLKTWPVQLGMDLFGGDRSSTRGESTSGMVVYADDVDKATEALSELNKELDRQRESMEAIFGKKVPEGAEKTEEHLGEMWEEADHGAQNLIDMIRQMQEEAARLRDIMNSAFGTEGEGEQGRYSFPGSGEGGGSDWSTPDEWNRRGDTASDRRYGNGKSGSGAGGSKNPRTGGTATFSGNIIVNAAAGQSPGQIASAVREIMMRETRNRIHWMNVGGLEA